MNKQLRIAIGLIGLILVVSALVSPPSVFLPRGIQVVDTELRGSSGNEQHVRTKLDFGDPERMSNLPLEDLGWSRVPEELSQVEGQLGADILLAWRCHHVSSSNRIWFLILQSRDVASFHPPPVCYAALGYNIEQEDTIGINVSGEGWAQEESISTLGEGYFFSDTLSVKRMIITKECNGSVCEKRVILYFYVKPNLSQTPNEITMVRVSAVVPVHGSFDHIQDLEEKLIADAFPLMFEPSDEERSLAKWLIDEWEIFGMFTIAVFVFIPITIMAYPLVLDRIKKKRSNSLKEGNPA